MIRRLIGRIAAAGALLLLVCWQPALAQEAEAPRSRMVEIEGIGTLPYYAQNDPRWEKSTYEPRGSDTRRLMRGSACGPTAIAMAIARQVPKERLPDLLQKAANPEKGFPFCACSVVADHRGENHEILSPTTPEDFAAYLPVIFASYATGNNDHWTRFRKAGVSGTSLHLFETLAEAYGLGYAAYSEWEDAFEALEEGCSVITTVTKGIFTASSHYLCIAGVADGWLYLLDPYMQSEYPRDHRGLLEVVEPGVIRTRMENMERLYLYGFYVIGNR